MMVTKIVLRFLLLFVTTIASAQHCIFDGSNVLVIKLVNKKGLAISKEKASFFLDFKNSNDKDSSNICTKNWTEQFDTCVNVFYKSKDAIWNRYAKVYEDLPLFKLKNCYAINLYNAQLKCLFANKKEIIISSGNKKYAVNKQNIYPLCSAFGKWENIKPLKIIVN